MKEIKIKKLSLKSSACFLNLSSRINMGDKAWNDLVSPYRKTADMGSFKMHYIDIGKGSPVILIHGFSDSTYCWHNNIHKLLDAKFRLIIVDQPGMGNSDMPPKPYIYSIENQTNAVISLTEKLSLKKFRLIGHSMGGGIALYMNYIIPGKIIKSVVIDPACFRLKQMPVPAFPGASVIASLLPEILILKKTLKNVYYNDDKISDKLINEYIRPMKKTGFWSMLRSLSIQYFSNEFDRMTENYDKIKKPLLIIWGKQDKWIPVEFGYKLNNSIKNSKLIVMENCGHNSHQECCGPVNSVILKFFKK